MAGVNRLSTQEIMKVSRETFKTLSSQQYFDISVVQKFFDSARFDLSDEEIKDVELALVLIASAHKASDKHFDEARRMLNLCDFLSSYRGNSVQRVVHYFAKALQHRIAQETGMISPENEARKQLLHPCVQSRGLDPALTSCCLQLPCVQICHFVATQAVLDNLGAAKKVHINDLEIICGVHCPLLMQALANRHECPVEHLKITAIVVPETRQKVEEIGRYLSYLAKTLNLPFSFRIVAVVEIKDLETEIFKISNDEIVAVLSLNVLRNIRTLSEMSKSLFTFLRSLNPCVLVIVEPEANHSSVTFIDRFHESLLSYGSFYDYIDACVHQGDPNRHALETMVGEEIRNIVGEKEEERIYRHMKIEEWRRYLKGFEMVEIEISMSCFNQATLLLVSRDGHGNSGALGEIRNKGL